MPSFLKTHWRLWIPSLLLGAGVVLVVLVFPPGSPSSDDIDPRLAPLPVVEKITPNKEDIAERESIEEVETQTPPAPKERNQSVAPKANNEQVRMEWEQEVVEEYPPIPMMRLRYGGEVYDGIDNGSCWLIEGLGKLCADVGGFPTPGDFIPVKAGDTLIVEIEAYQRTGAVNIVIVTPEYEEIQHLIRTGSTVEFGADLPAGMYLVFVSSGYTAGNVGYAFKIKIN